MKKRILIVDDDPAILGGLSMLLEENYETLTALDGEEALRVLGQHTVDLIILDMLMPVLDGAGVLKTLTAQGSEIPVIVISAHKNLQDRAQTLGAADAIAKPFDIDGLERKIAQLVGPSGDDGGNGGAPSTPFGAPPGESGSWKSQFGAATY